MPLSQEMRVAHGLVLAAHDPEGHDHPAVAFQHAGDDRVQRPLAGRDAVGVPGLDDEALAAVLQNHPAARSDQPAAEGVEQRIDEADRRALAVDDAEIDRVLVDGCPGRRQLGHGAIRPDRRAQLGGVGLGQQPVDRHLGLGRIGDEAVAVLIGQPRRLDLQMQTPGRQRLVPGEVEARQHVERDERGQPLAVGRAFVDPVTAVVGTDRGDILALGRGEVLERV
jgi:hypothetical protein